MFHGLCKTCIQDRALCNLVSPVVSNTRDFARCFYQFNNRIRQENLVNFRLHGLISHDDIETLEEVRRVLQQDIHWRGRPGNSRDLPTFEQRQVVADIGDHLFKALVRNREATRPQNILRRRQMVSMRVKLSSIPEDDRTCGICYETFGELNEYGNVIKARKFNCHHRFCSLDLDKILQDGASLGSTCPYC